MKITKNTYERILFENGDVWLKLDRAPNGLIHVDKFLDPILSRKNAADLARWIAILPRAPQARKATHHGPAIERNK